MIKGIFNEIDKEIKFTQESSATTEEVKREIDKATIGITIEHSNNKPRQGKAFQQEPEPSLSKEYDE